MLLLGVSSSRILARNAAPSLRSCLPFLRYSLLFIYSFVYLLIYFSLTAFTHCVIFVKTRKAMRHGEDTQQRSNPLNRVIPPAQKLSGWPDTRGTKRRERECNRRCWGTRNAKALGVQDSTSYFISLVCKSGIHDRFNDNTTREFHSTVVTLSDNSKQANRTDEDIGLYRRCATILFGSYRRCGWDRFFKELLFLRLVVQKESQRLGLKFGMGIDYGLM